MPKTSPYSVGMTARNGSDKFFRESAGWSTPFQPAELLATERGKMIAAFGAGALVGWFARGSFWWVLGGLAAAAVVSQKGRISP